MDRTDRIFLIILLCYTVIAIALTVYRIKRRGRK